MCSLQLLFGIAALYVALVVPCMVYAIPLDQFYDYGTTAGDDVLPKSDDGASPAIPLDSVDFNFFANNQSTCYVSFYTLLSQ